MNERQMKNALENLLANLIDAQRRNRDDIEMPDGMGEIAGVEDFVQAGVLTHDAGLIVTMKDGSEFQLTIVCSR